MKQFIHALFPPGFFLLILFSCSEEKEDLVRPNSANSNLPTIAEWLVSQNNDFDSLKLALEESGLLAELNQPGNYTLFAQKNNAYPTGIFVMFHIPQAYIAEIPDSLLRISMQKSIFKGKVILDTNLAGAYYTTTSHTAPGNRAQMYFMNYKREKFSGDMRINSAISVLDANIPASNGTIHIIDRLLSSRNIGSFLLDDDSLSQMSQALNSFLDLSNYIYNASNDKSVKTLLVPSNQAIRDFVALDTSIDYLYQMDTTELRKLLNHHLIKGTHLTSSQFSNGPLRTNNGDDLMISINNGINITSSGSISAKVIDADKQGENGIIHIIDRVLAPN